MVNRKVKKKKIWKKETLDCQIQAKICGQTEVELDAALEHLGKILEYFEEFQWTYRRYIGTF